MALGVRGGQQPIVGIVNVSGNTAVGIPGLCQVAEVVEGIEGLVTLGIERHLQTRVSLRPKY